MMLHDLRRVAHKMGLLVLEYEDKLLVTNNGTAAKGLCEALVDTTEEALVMVMAERNGRESMLKGKY